MQEITTGVWRIANGDRYLRDYDGAILVGPGKPENSDNTSKWRLDYMDPQRKGFTITNIETGRHAFANPPHESAVISGRETKWCINPEENGFGYQIQFPNEKYYWTVAFVPIPGVAPVILQDLAVGKPEQIWRFEWIGDF